MTEQGSTGTVVEDHQLRSLIKTITWRVIATLTTGGLVYLFTGKFALAVEVGLLEVALKLLFYYLHEYYLHERGWERIRWGQTEHPLASLSVKQPLLPKDRKIIEQRLRELGCLR